ncbi:hypothetical protein O5O45_12590 [Hahella aquimaris]|uniref:hypothetical protein n=1 Tax=Hahella sp. HNIBRBA332 TaxID=3015983 RepID=UPI00273C6DF9|nr:hypothetical protein [Hahella sp. HNIBRBA332]WLQ16756.1 hypothetical protein O5O45_12590 [Hahella sp. HNIBRBA332]
MKLHIDQIFEEIDRKIVETIEDIEPNIGEIYVAGFWLFYCDYTVLSRPCFSYNSENTDEQTRWSPPDWTVDIDDIMDQALAPLYEKITALMENCSEKEWDTLLDFQFEFYCNLCQKLNNDLMPFKKWSTTKNFVIGIFEERESEDVYHSLIKNSIGHGKAIELGII